MREPGVSNFRFRTSRSFLQRPPFQLLALGRGRQEGTSSDRRGFTYHFPQAASVEKWFCQRLMLKEGSVGGIFMFKFQFHFVGEFSLGGVEDR